MTRLLLSRLVAAVPTLLLVIVGAFALLGLAPGDATDAYLAQIGGGDASLAAALRERFGVGATLPVYLAAVLSGDLGQSAVFDRPVRGLIMERLPLTLALMAAATAIAVGLGGVLGYRAGAAPGGAADHLASGAALVLMAMPNFWLGLLLIVLLSVSLGWLPVGGSRSLLPPEGLAADLMDRARHLIMPSLALGLGHMAMTLRVFRAGMVAAGRSSLRRAAEARGLPPAAVRWRTMGRPALLPVAALTGQQAGALVGGSVVVETVFALPGLGRLAFEAVQGRDPVLLAGVVIAGAVLVIAINLLVDLLLPWLDPRVGLAHG